MELLDTVHKRKSATITTVIMILLLLLIFFFGMSYMDPPIESGIAVNFGASEMGSGNVQPKTPVKTEVNPVVENEVEEVVEEKVEESSPVDDAPSEEVLTQESEESILLKQKEKEKKDAEEADRLAKIQADKDAKEEADRIQKEKDDKKAKLDALMGGLNTNDGSETGGEGNDNVAGDKGKITGDPNASGYYGNGGSGGSGDYQLGGRKNLNSPQPDYPGQEDEGLVIVEIEVDRSGKVVKAKGGVKGTTVIDAKIILRAEEAALKTTWEADDKAGFKQIGYITYRFGLGK